MSARPAGMKVAIRVTDGFEQVELTEPRDAIERESGITRIVSDKKDSVLGLDHIGRSAWTVTG